MSLPLYFITFGGLRRGPLSKDDIQSLYDAGMVDLDFPVTGPSTGELSIRDLVTPNGASTRSGVSDVPLAELDSAVR